MRIWSLHPKYMDAKGLVALWRETLLAKKVLEGKTKGYKNHPQLDRFKLSRRPLDAINQYLEAVLAEADQRNYRFDRKKIDWKFRKTVLTVTKGQMDYEASHLSRKLKTRDPERFKSFRKVKKISAHPLFRRIKGEIAAWEIPVIVPARKKTN